MTILTSIQCNHNMTILKVVQCIFFLITGYKNYPQKSKTDKQRIFCLSEITAESIFLLLFFTLDFCQQISPASFCLSLVTLLIIPMSSILFNCIYGISF